MKTKFFCLLLFFFALVPSFALDKHGQAAYQTVKNAEMFAVGGVGRAGVITRPEIAMRILMTQSDGVSALKSLAATARPAGKLYALLGLRWIKASVFHAQRETFRTIQTPIKTMSGCTGGRESVAAVAERIAGGNFDVLKKNTRWRRAG